MADSTENRLQPVEMVKRTHEFSFGEKKWRFDTRAGSLILEDSKGIPTAEIFSVGYFLEGQEAAKRPITFAFNGGPGASSVWVHLGAMGPWRVSFGETITQPAPCHDFETNPHSWLEFTDIVFIDAPGTGFSRALGETDPKSHWGVAEDGKVFADFIRLYCTTFARWLSPKYIAGESYGGMRAVALCKELQETHGMDLTGLLLISPVVDYQTMANCAGNHIAACCFLPSYTATAHHFGLLPPHLQESLDETLVEAEDFAINEYLPALAQGTSLDEDRRTKCTERYAELTGLSPEYVRKARLSVDCVHYRKELLREQEKTIGRFDSRLIGHDYNLAGSVPEYDPSDCLTVGPFVAPFNDLLASKLGVQENRVYNIQSNEPFKHWQWFPKDKRSYGFVNLTPELRRQIMTNEHLNVLFVCGIYDIATPYFSSKYTINALRLPSNAKERVGLLRYPGGHMMYTDQQNHEKLTEDIRLFYEKTTVL